MKVLKDLNFIELGMKLDIYEEHRFEALEIIEKDAQFLSKNNLMDYSLLFIKSAKAK